MASDETRLRFEHDEGQRRAQKDRRLLDADMREASIPLTVALVGCGKKKKKTRARACDIYTGTLFRLAYEYAERTADDVHILSALHGLLPPFQEIESYELPMNRMLIHEQKEWGNSVVSDLFTFYPLTPLRIIFYAGLAYIRPILEAAVDQAGYWDMQMPLEGLDLFERIRWFREQAKPIQNSAT